jgi:hypothetical protein
MVRKLRSCAHLQESRASVRLPKPVLRALFDNTYAEAILLIDGGSVAGSETIGRRQCNHRTAAAGSI